MKKFLLLICCLVVLGLTACDTAEGTWKMESKTTEVFGFQKTFGIGDKDELGKEITEDYMVVVFEKDGTGSLTQAYVDGSFTFTWAEEDDEIKVTGTLVNFVAKIEDGYLVFKYLGSTYKLKK